MFPADLASVIQDQRDRDVIGTVTDEALASHAGGFASFMGPEPRRVLDLGSGGGIPGLVLAKLFWRDASILLADSSKRRIGFLERCVEELDLAPRVSTLWARAEVQGRAEAHRGAYDAVVARSFGPPAALVECAAPLLQVGGLLVVSDPPGSQRWNNEELEPFGLVLELTSDHEGARFSRLRQAEICPERFPRRTGVPFKRPLF